MDVRQLSYVLAVADEGTFTRAAEVLQISQPSLSQGIRALEAELGAALFERRARPVRLTAAGEALIEPARRAVRDLQTARAAVEAVTGLEGGHLDLVSLPTLSIDPVAELVGRFRVAHPRRRGAPPRTRRRRVGGDPRPLGRERARRVRPPAG